MHTHAESPPSQKALTLAHSGNAKRQKNQLDSLTHNAHALATLALIRSHSPARSLSLLLFAVSAAECDNTQKLTALPSWRIKVIGAAMTHLV